jgi:hypothetical protein
MLLDLVLEPPASGPDPEQLAERGEQVDLVRRALLLTRDADRTLLGLRYYGEWTDAELASLLGISRGAVRKRLHDARGRLRPILASQTITMKEHAMTDVTQLLGSIVDPATAATPPEAGLTAPPPGAILPTGIKVLDAAVPWPRGGTVDFLGTVGTGHLVILGEILHNLLDRGPAALVAVASTEAAADGAWPNLQRLLEPEALPDRTLVVQAGKDRAALAVEYAARCAASLAAGGAQVLLAVDRAIANALGETLFEERVGVAAGGGSVTGVRVAPHQRDAEPVPAWPTAGTVTVTSLAELAAGRHPAIDVLASGSAVLEQAAARHRRVAADCRRVLTEAAAVRAYLTQNFWMAQEHTGEAGEAFTLTQAVSGLAERVGAPGPRQP